MRNFFIEKFIFLWITNIHTTSQYCICQSIFFQSSNMPVPVYSPCHAAYDRYTIPCQLLRNFFCNFAPICTSHPGSDYCNCLLGLIRQFSNVIQCIWTVRYFNQLLRIVLHSDARKINSCKNKILPLFFYIPCLSGSIYFFYIFSC